MTKTWLPLESNPDVLNEYLKSLGLTNPKVAFNDVFGLDAELLAMVPRPIYAMILLYPLSDGMESGDAAACLKQKSEIEQFMTTNKFFYSKQTISNACGTMAVLHAVLNNTDVVGDMLEGSPIATLLWSTKDKSPEENAKLIESDSLLDQAHALASASGVTDNQPLDADIDLHFTCFVKIGDRCVELDGRKPHPLLHGHCVDEESFVKSCVDAIKEKMGRDPQSPRFNIIALCESRE
ncbi:ubiquitin carboxyl-terminal hydrolase, putative [Trypanosoma equiperdum]|uniref:Ubiquitin carboxyl-terminal hydrolase n=2 Tax=Trypanozoon TaxID=39700 RepID=Q387M6_TRYB2|nr:ubiquitin carboxyl-terminal hydrolase, putative [Trypanosoma brucei brucei TREU927]EAN79005.1 ubiquitin carboxyl-terminal hydrolase, putative [Trypanosoma brucei brucei TREU927]SCU67768.1 ubiquitin carboxyl-terminal hydrolase, putative [Trypanosoma equiperdum]